MLCKKVVALTNASEIVVENNNIYDKNYVYAFASDLMSDCLTLIDDDREDLILISGLANSSSIRTCEMLDIDFILLVRGKVLEKRDIELANRVKVNVFTTNKTMYEVCGILNKYGLKHLGADYG